MNVTVDDRPEPRLFRRLRGLPVLVQDGLIVAAVLLVSIIALATSGPDRLPSDETARPVDVGAYLLILVAVVPLIVRRRVPYVSIGVALATLLVFAGFDYGGIFVGYAILVGVYSVSVHRGLVPGMVAGLITFAILLLSYRISSWQPNAADNAFDLLAVATAVALGDGTRNRVRVSEAQSVRLELAASEQERVARERVLEERTRIARELHDLVAHSMSIVAVQAGMGHHLIDRDPGKAKEALSTIETTSRQSLTEMRRMLGVLRADEPDDAASLEPQPGSADIATLVAEAASNGLDVELLVDGRDDANRLDDLEPGVALSAYRIVQEALTNVRKHAGPARVTVSLVRSADSLRITVDDDGRGLSASSTGDPGFGLVGMRERAAVVGGEVTAGARPGGGFRVRATLPLGASS